jgi:signal transduction histidine kinase
MKNKILPLLMTLLLVCMLLHTKGQTSRIETLRKEFWDTQKPEETKTELLFKLCEQNESLHSDSLGFYVTRARQLTEKDTGFTGPAKVKLFEAAYLIEKGKLDSASYLLNRLMEDPRMVQVPELSDAVKVEVANILVKQKKLSEALKYSLATVQEAQRNGNPDLLVRCMTITGKIHNDRSEYPDALRMFRKALQTSEQNNAKDKRGEIAFHMARTYRHLQKKDSAFYFINQAIEDARKSENLGLEANAYNTYAAIIRDSGNRDSAEVFLEKSLLAREKIGDPEFLISGLLETGQFYLDTRQSDKSIAALRRGILVSKENHQTNHLLSLYSALAENYRREGRLEDYSTTVNLLLTLKDSLEFQHDLETISALESKYQLQQKEKTILQQQLELTRKKQLIQGILITGGILLPFGFFVYYNNRKRKEQNMEISRLEKGAELQKAISEAREQERKRIAADLHDQLGSYAAAISLNASNIGKIAKSEEEKNAVSELNKNASAIVSQLNDTIWVLTREVLSFTAIADRLKVYVLNLQKSYRHFDFRFEEKIGTDHLLGPAPGLHLLKILQEGITNAVKHSNGSRVAISFESKAENWEIDITDDGVGLPPPTADLQEGNGMANMKKRAREGNMEIGWRKSVAGGTTLFIKGKKDVEAAI